MVGKSELTSHYGCFRIGIFKQDGNRLIEVVLNKIQDIFYVVKITLPCSY